VSPIDDVPEFCEAMPSAELDDEKALYANPDRRRAQFHLTWPDERPRAGLEILVAGCGTSQAARYALREPDAHVTAIDVSETSLRHTRELQRTYGLANLDLRRLSIESAGELGQSFDLIVCTGVLHHLPDPDAGLHSLRDVLRPQGAMRLMVYARYGRAGIYMMQEYCRLVGVGSSDDELRDLGATLAALPPDHPIAAVLRREKDFLRPESVADALLHPRDRAYSVTEVYDWMERCGMYFGRWIEQAPYMAQCGLPAASPHAARLAELPARQQHAAVELFRGTMVSHSFVAYRDDRVADTRSAAFDDDRRRTCVPIVLPWTVCVRERVPAGSVAVLINRAHTFSDLALAVDAFEDRLYGAIDGKRTIADILKFAEAGGDDARALRFFERLSQYDQIVFDASSSAPRR